VCHTLQGVKDDLELLSAEKDHLQEVGEELVGLIGEPDKPEVERSIEDMDAAFKALDDACDTRQRALDDALRRATCFHDELTVSVCPFITLPAAAADNYDDDDDDDDDVDNVVLYSCWRRRALETCIHRRDPYVHDVLNW